MKRQPSEEINGAEDLFPSTEDLETSMDDEQCTELTPCQLTASEKKRRLGTDQVRALERHFELENKLDPDRKTRLAVDLGLQPRQVAIWFQNRRARSKTKNLEKDFNSLKSRYDELLVECESLRRDKDSLSDQIRELQSKLENSKAAVVKLETNNTILYKDGASDSDSSIVFNEESIDQCFIDTYQPTDFPCKGFLEENFEPEFCAGSGSGTGFFSIETDWVD
ncbi:hypothetical protein LUZ60_005724 [Juncus effusus]|nr:hypothetical protein LUZ60_005724 [Juncus effusus]